MVVVAVVVVVVVVVGEQLMQDARSGTAPARRLCASLAMRLGQTNSRRAPYGCGRGPGASHIQSRSSRRWRWNELPPRQHLVDRQLGLESRSACYREESNVNSHTRGHNVPGPLTCRVGGSVGGLRYIGSRQATLLTPHTPVRHDPVRL